MTTARRAPAAVPARVPLPRAAGRALLLRCPNCGGRKVLASWFALRERCPTCGVVLERGESDHFIGAYTLNLVFVLTATGVLLVLALLLTWPDPPWDAITYGGAAFMVALAVIAYPFAKVLWLAVDLRFRPASRGAASEPGRWVDDL
jgi:uncharacterized protein (DUF983 family)